jgi:hypothetical protein
MAGKDFRRRQLVVDQQVQGALLFRVTLYWFFCLLSVALLLMCWTIVTGPRMHATALFNELCYRYGPAFVCSVLVLPLVLVDCARLSNTFVGPMFRLRRAMQRLAKGEVVEPIKFRENDFWKEVAKDFNEVLVRVQGDVPDTTDDDEESAFAEEEPADAETVAG